MRYLIKILVSSVILVAVAELAKRNSTLAALLASLPLTSLLAFVWMKTDGAPSADIALLSLQIAVLVVPSLLLFVSLWWLLRHDMPFWQALLASCIATVIAYAVTLPVLKRVGLAP